MGVLGGGWTMESGGGQGRGGWIKESVNLVSVGGWVCVCVGVLSVGLGPGLDSMSPARSRRSASHAVGTHGWLPQKTGRPGLRRGGVGGYNLHSVPPTVALAHQPRAGCIRLVLFSSFILSINVFPVSMVVSPKGSIEYCFLYASYRLFDSSVRPGMFPSKWKEQEVFSWWFVHGMYHYTG